MTRILFVFVAAIVACLTLYQWVLDEDGAIRMYNEQISLTSLTRDKPTIPNLVHYVYVLKNSSSDELAFSFGDYLSMAASSYYLRPTKLFLHTDAPAETIKRAQKGLSGKWSRLMFDLPGFTVMPATVPRTANNGMEINIMEHKSDFVRVAAVKAHGGLYVDFDVYPLRDLRSLRHSGFQGVVGRQLEGSVNSGTFLSAPGSKMIKLWHREMYEVYDGSWEEHSNSVIRRVSENLISEPGEALILERNAFAPGSWTSQDASHLFEVHDDVESNLAHLDEEDTDPLIHRDHKYDGNMTLIPSDRPSWATNWSQSFLLHAFKPSRTNTKPAGFDQVTPRYVLEGKSNFARAVYPVAKNLYKRGLITEEEIQ
ncbi:glycosyl transferase [Moelleriella libera RCEF 2490]|uniref:Glycosyl transferase n=1 Tax=Moelleriella libera RCEF 2490 TaxID=1081109 RepID=A0A168DFM6_9HYPO|nr:glycosyl transferase [Moelleriella libera RCEF 2490]